MSHDPSEIIQISWFDAAETFLINIIIKTVFLNPKHVKGTVFLLIL